MVKSRMRRGVAAAATIVLAVAGVQLLVQSAAQASLSTCNSTASITDGQDFAWVPSFGTNINCVLQYAPSTHNNAVWQLQHALNHDWDGEPGYVHLTEDGYFGTNTRNDVRFVQGRYNIGVDGIYGPQTRNHICWPDFGDGPCLFF